MLMKTFCTLQCKVKQVLIYGQNVDGTNIHEFSSITDINKSN